VGAFAVAMLLLVFGVAAAATAAAGVLLTQRRLFFVFSLSRLRKHPCVRLRAQSVVRCSALLCDALCSNWPEASGSSRARLGVRVSACVWRVTRLHCPTTTTFHFHFSLPFSLSSPSSSSSSQSLRRCCCCCRCPAVSLVARAQAGAGWVGSPFACCCHCSVYVRRVRL
jgi:hypothetical protein